MPISSLNIRSSKVTVIVARLPRPYLLQQYST